MVIKLVQLRNRLYTQQILVLECSTPLFTQPVDLPSSEKNMYAVKDKKV